MLLLLVVCSGAFASCSSSGSGASKGASSTAETRRVVPSSASTTAPTASGDGWTTYYGNPERTGVAGDLARTHDGLSRQWTSATLDGDLYAEPLLVGSRVLVGTANDSVYSLDGAGGTG